MADLSKTLLAARVRNLYESRRSGVLVATQDGTSKGVFFRNGQVVFASSTLEKEKLGESLIRLGRISRPDFLAAVQASAGRGRRVGRALVEAGLISDEELGRVVAVQVQKIVLSLFTWRTGEARFHEAPEAIPEDVAVDLSTARLLFEGIRIFPDVARLEKALPPPHRRLRLVTRPPFDHATMSLSPAERDVLVACADELTIAEILERPRRDLLVRALYAFLAGGVLEDPSQDEPRPPVPAELDADTGTFRLALGPQVPPPEEDARTRVLRLYEALPRATHYEVLGVAPDATLAQVADAHDRQLEEEKGWSALAQDARLASVLSTLRLRRRSAWHVLSDTHRREAYDRSLGRPVPPRATVAPAAPLADDPRRKASRILRDARRMLDDGERDRAITLALEGVSIDPQDGELRKLVAIALGEHPTLQRSAERHFRAALELRPDDVELRYGLAQFYRKAGLPRRAINELQAVLAQEPDHHDANTLIRVLERTAGAPRRWF